MNNLETKTFIVAGRHFLGDTYTQKNAHHRLFWGRVRSKGMSMAHSLWYVYRQHYIDVSTKLLMCGQHNTIQYNTARYSRDVCVSSTGTCLVY